MNKILNRQQKVFPYMNKYLNSLESYLAKLTKKISKEYNGTYEIFIGHSRVFYGNKTMSIKLDRDLMLPMVIINIKDDKCLLKEISYGIINQSVYEKGTVIEHIDDFFNYLIGKDNC